MKIYPITNKNTHIVASNKCYGIDLGTTYSLMAEVDAAYVDLSKSNKVPVHFIRFKQSSPNPYDALIEDEKVASIAAFIDNKPYIGNNLYHLKGKDGIEFRRNIFYHWKVEMGVDQHPLYPDAVTEKLDMPYKVAAFILKYLRTRHLNSQDQTLDNTIITVPASFQMNQRLDTLKAAQLASIRTYPEMLIDEPNAAFLGYFNRLSEETKNDWAKNLRNKNVLVVDFGGGTLDLSVLNVNFSNTSGIMLSNKAISRYNDLGGQDLDHLLAEQFLYPKLERAFPEIASLTTTELQQAILPQLSVWGEKLKKQICEKISLNSLDQDARSLDLATLSVTVQDCQITFDHSLYNLGDVTLNGAEFDQLFAKIFQGKKFRFEFIDKTITTISHSISELLERTNLYLNEVNYVLYAGGSCFNPLLCSYIGEKLPSALPLSCHEPDKLVAEGAAVYAYFYHVHGLSLITPITSDTIGIRIKGNRFKSIIAEGCQLPVEVKLSEFSLQSNLQHEIVVPVCINSIDFPIGDLRCCIDGFYAPGTAVTIEASLTANKVFEIKIFIDDEQVGHAEFDNPYSTGQVTAEEREFFNLKSQLNQAKQQRNKREEKKYLYQLIYKHSEVNNALGVIENAEEYVNKFDDQDANIWNLLFCHYHHLGREKAARAAIEKAMQLEPATPTYIYNYSLILEDSDLQQALDLLSQQPDWVKADRAITIKRILLSHKLDLDWKEDAIAVVDSYKNAPYSYSDFEKRVLLPSLFRLLNQPYSYVAPNKAKNTSDEKSYLVALSD